MYLSEFLARHLRHNFKTVECADICKMCGKHLVQGVKQKDVIKKATFNDYQYLTRKSNFMCIECSALIGDIQFPCDDKKRRLRSFSFIAELGSIKILKRDRLLEYIIDPPEPPFVFCITYSNKKHIAFKSQIQFDKKAYTVFTDKGAVLIDLKVIKELLVILSAWYTVLPGKEDTKQQPTWFTKGEILKSGKNYKNIIAYGLQKYQQENCIIEPYRNTALLTLLAFALNKKIDFPATKTGQLKF